MPKSALTGGGRSFLSGPRADVRKRGFRSGTFKEPEGPMRLPTGEMLNIPESKIYRALQKMRVRFDPQVPLGGGRTLGGALVDFVLWDYNIALEYQGPFHDTTEGAERDFWRLVTREQAGLMTVYLYERDLVNIHRRLSEIMGAPYAAVAQSRR